MARCFFFKFSALSFFLHFAYIFAYKDLSRWILLKIINYRSSEHVNLFFSSLGEDGGGGVYMNSNYHGA